MLHRIKRDESGFTLIELLVVILIIGILAAIALPAFLGQQKKGQDGEAKSNARNLVTHVESCFAETQTYVSCKTPAQLPDTGLNVGTEDLVPTTQGQVAVTESGAKTYTIVALSKSGQHFAIVKGANGVSTRTCGSTMTAPGVAGGTAEGGCPSTKTW